MKLRHITAKGLVILTSLFALSVPVAQAALYQGEVELTYTSSLPSGFVITITDALFPAGHGIFTSCQADGGDLQLFQGATRLPLELVTYDQGAESLLLFTRLTSSLATGEKLTLQCGSDAGVLAQPGVTETYGRNAVWQDYAFVTHDLVTDSTGNHSITNTGGATQNGPHALKARGFAATFGAGTTDKSVTSYTSNAAVRTIQSFVYMHGYGGGSLGRWYDKGNPNDQVFVRPGIEHGLGYERFFSNALADWRQLDTPSTPQTDTWELVHLAHDATSDANEPIFYHNGTANTWEYEKPFSGTLLDNSTALTWGNRNSDNARVWDGMLAEARIRESILDAVWVAAEYTNFTTPTSFVSATAFAVVNTDFTVPTLSAIDVSGITGTTATLSWTTDEDASTQVVYGLTAVYDLATAEVDTAPRVTSHQHTLTGLATCTTYHYAVVSKDAPGNTATSSDGTFTTTDCPVPTPTPAPSSGGGGGASTLPWCSGPQAPGWDSNILGGGCTAAPQPDAEQTTVTPALPQPPEPEAPVTVAPLNQETPAATPVVAHVTPTNPVPAPEYTPTQTPTDAPTTLLAVATQEVTSSQPDEPVMRSLLHTILSFFKRWYQSAIVVYLPS